MDKAGSPLAPDSLDSGGKPDPLIRQARPDRHVGVAPRRSAQGQAAQGDASPRRFPLDARHGLRGAGITATIPKGRIVDTRHERRRERARRRARYDLQERARMKQPDAVFFGGASRRGRSDLPIMQDDKWCTGTGSRSQRRACRNAGASRSRQVADPRRPMRWSRPSPPRSPRRRRNGAVDQASFRMANTQTRRMRGDAEAAAGRRAAQGG